VIHVQHTTTDAYMRRPITEGQSACMFRASASADLVALSGRKDGPSSFPYQVDASSHTPPRGARLADQLTHQDQDPAEDPQHHNPATLRRFIMASMVRVVPGSFQCSDPKSSKHI
jgi:hypothetical protein